MYLNPAYYLRKVLKKQIFNYDAKILKINSFFKIIIIRKQITTHIQ